MFELSTFVTSPSRLNWTPFAFIDLACIAPKDESAVTVTFWPTNKLDRLPMLPSTVITVDGFIENTLPLAVLSLTSIIAVTPVIPISLIVPVTTVGVGLTGVTGFTGFTGLTGLTGLTGFTLLAFFAWYSSAA